MNEKTEQLVRELAEKLGTTAEHLRSVLIKQAPITAATDVVIAVVMVALLWAAYRLVRSKTTIPPAIDGYRYHPSAEWRKEDVFLAWLILAVYGAITTVSLCCTIANVVTATLNPEYWALKQLLP